MINETVEKYLGEGGFKQMADSMADELNSLMGDGWDAVDAAKKVAKKYKYTVKQVNQAYEDSYGMPPSEFE